MITTIMFNFIAAGLLNYLLVDVLRPPTSMDPSTASFPEATHLPTLHEILAPFGIAFSKAAPANVTLLHCFGGVASGLDIDLAHTAWLCDPRLWRI